MQPSNHKLMMSENTSQTASDLAIKSYAIPSTHRDKMA
jgi:hypothetical protein